MVAAPSPPCAIDIVTDSPLWNHQSAVAEPWLRNVVEATLPAGHATCELAIVFTDDRAIRTLNARFRGRDAPTNVLSFPPPSFPAVAGKPVPLGDVVIAFETAQAEAAAQGKEFFQHVTHLLVHGVLHLLGYDHRSDAEAESMEMRERIILRRLGIPDPYQQRTGAPAGDFGNAASLAQPTNGGAAPLAPRTDDASSPDRAAHERA